MNLLVKFSTPVYILFPLVCVTKYLDSGAISYCVRNWSVCNKHQCSTIKVMYRVSVGGQCWWERQTGSPVNTSSWLSHKQNALEQKASTSPEPQISPELSQWDSRWSRQLRRWASRCPLLHLTEEGIVYLLQRRETEKVLGPGNSAVTAHRNTGRREWPSG